MSLPTPLEITRSLIQIPTINPPGNELSAQEYIVELLEAGGFEVKRYQSIPQRPNLAARLPGSGKREPLIFYGHTDVVGVEGQTWTHPPFQAFEQDGFLFGRGTLDMKAGVAMLVQSLLRSKSEGIIPGGDILLIIVVDEETGGEHGMQFLLDNHPSLFEGVRHAIGEFGGFPLYAFDKKFYRIGVSQKSYAHLRLSVQAPGGHGSYPSSGTVMQKFGLLLQELDTFQLPYQKTPLAEEIIHLLAKHLPASQQETLLGLLDRDTFNTSLQAIGKGRETFESLFRSTANPTIARSGEKFNVIPSFASVDLDVRMLPGRSVSDEIKELENYLSQEVNIELLAAGPSTQPYPDLSLYPLLSEILRQMDPEGIPIPYLFNESPDGRLLEEFGVQNNGFLPMNLPPEIDLPAVIHGADERVPLSAIEFGAEALYQLIKNY
jgi:acetylornithine deacetylase/succinyl-diaminopimelate desuccinylase-like protein